jgi:hypothetical protein
MVQNDFDKVEKFLELPKYLSLSLFEDYLVAFLERKADKKLAVQELDKIIAVLQNHMLSLSLYLKQNYLLARSSAMDQKSENEFYTKQEIAIKYRVSVRTVSNWIIDGLEAIDIGGVKRISHQAILDFVNQNKTKKFHWKSIVK